MSMLATMTLNRLFGTAPKMETRRRDVKKSTTATMRALSDLGESIASGVHVLYGSVRLYLCVTMQPKPEALAAQKKEDKRQAALKGQEECLHSERHLRAGGHLRSKWHRVTGGNEMTGCRKQDNCKPNRFLIHVCCFEGTI